MMKVKQKHGRIPAVLSIGMLVCLLVSVLPVQAQILKLPRVSPAMSVTGTIGFTRVTIDYSSPAVKGREIWGKLVPYGLTTSPFGAGTPAPWRAGANENTVITFTDDVKINGKALAAGSYGLHMIPGETQWTIIFSKNYTSWGSFFYYESEDALRITVSPKKAEFKEWLTYGFDDFTTNSAEVFLHWEKLKVSFNVEVDVDKIVLANIKNQLRSTAGFTWQGYMQAAAYYFRQNTHLDLALEWIKKSISINENEQNRNILGYIHMTQGNLEEALGLLKENVKKYPDSWNVYDSLAECYKKQDKKKEAVKYYKIALKKAPANQKKRIEDIIKELSGK